MPAIIGWIVAGISRIFATRLGAWVAQAMFFLGLQWATHEFAVEPLLAQVQSAVASGGGTVVAWVGFFNVDRYFTCILSAYAVVAGKRAILQRRPGA